MNDTGSAVVPDTFLEISTAIRYVAFSIDGKVQMTCRRNLTNRSSSESDRYEELLVNPALLNLAGNRGAIDCGGLQFILIRYGSFFQLVHPIRSGHVSVAIEPSADPLQVAALVRRALKRFGLI
jgi:hypothetical protein